MSATNERNKKVSSILDSIYANAINDDYLVDESKYSNSLNKLFTTSAWGFREILLVVIIRFIIQSLCGLI